MVPGSIVGGDATGSTGISMHSKHPGIVKLWKCCKCRHTGKLQDSPYNSHCKGDNCLHEWCKICDSYSFDLADNNIKSLPRGDVGAPINTALNEPTSTSNDLSSSSSPSSLSPQSLKRRGINAKSQQKRRNEVKSLLDEIKQLVPELKYSEHTKSDSLSIAADFIENMSNGNKALRVLMHKLQKRENPQEADAEFRQNLRDWRVEVSDLRIRVERLEEIARRYQSQG